MGKDDAMGRHRKPDSTRSTVGKLAAVATSGAFAAIPLTQGTAFAEETHPAIHSVPTDDGWDIVAPAIARCESGSSVHPEGNLRAHNPTSSASGKYQMVRGTWLSVADQGWPRSAAQASLEQQEIAAHRLFDRDGTSPWNASKHCWGRLVSARRAPFQMITRLVSQSLGRHRHAGRHRAQVEQPQARPQIVEASTRYVVKPGDTLYGIGLQHHKTWQEVWEENRAVVQNPSLINIGLNLSL